MFDVVIGFIGLTIPLLWFGAVMFDALPLPKLLSTIALSWIWIILIVFMFLRPRRDPILFGSQRLAAFGRATVRSLPLLVIAGWAQVGLPPVSSTLFAIGLAVLILCSVYSAFTARRGLKALIGRAILVLIALLYPIFDTYWEGRAAFSNLAVVDAIDAGSCAGPGLFAHISDVHEVEDAAKRTIDGDIPGNSRLPDLLARISRHEPPYLVISGDVTDRGLEGEWNRALDALKQISARTRVILAPGNHDLSLFFASSMTENRLKRFLGVQDTLFPELRTANDKTLQEAFSAEPSPDDPVYRAATETIKECSDLCASMPEISVAPTTGLGGPNSFQMPQSFRSLPVDGRGDPATALRHYFSCQDQCYRSNPRELRIIEEHADYWFHFGQEAFPLYWVDTENHIALFSLMFEAIGSGTTLGTNAVGRLDERQAERLLKLVESLPNSISTVVITEHYPIARGPNDTMAGPAWRWSEFGIARWWKALENSQWWSYALLRAEPGAANPLLRSVQRLAAQNPDRNFFLLFGHRHLRSLGTVGRVVLAEAPNVASQSDDGFYLGTELAGGKISVAWCR